MEIPDPWKTILGSLVGAGGLTGAYKLYIDYQNNKQSAQQKQREGWSAEGKQIFDVLSGQVAALQQTNRNQQDDINALRKENRESDDRYDALRESVMNLKESHQTEINAIRDAHHKEIEEMRRLHKVELDRREESLTGLKSVVKRLVLILLKKEVPPADLLTELQVMTEK